MLRTVLRITTAEKTEGKADGVDPPVFASSFGRVDCQVALPLWEGDFGDGHAETADLG